MAPDHTAPAPRPRERLAGFRPGLLHYRFDPDLAAYAHNYERDLHMFVLWERSREQWPAILEDLAHRFTVLDVRHITWPTAQVDDNFLRLYGAPPQRGAGAHFKRKKIVGAGTFALVTVEDKTPRYIYDRTFSKKVELVNRSIIEAKARYRDWTGGGFRIHSSNSLGEFFRDMTLLVGADELSALLERTGPYAGEPAAVDASLAGADGWPSIRSLFEHLMRSVDCMVLRNFESLPEALLHGDADVDALCRLPQDVAAIANATVRIDANGKFACETLVSGKPLAMDLRFVGDGYYDASWQSDMLARAQLQRGCVLVPAPEDHFFSLLYHAKLHKRAVKPSYGPRLAELARVLGLPAYAGVELTADEAAAGLLAGYLASSHYQTCVPLDVWVDYHASFAVRLQAEGLLWERERMRDRLTVSAVLARLPLLWRWRDSLTGPATSALRAARKFAWRATR
jgi:hypothetical protein